MATVTWDITSNKFPVVVIKKVREILGWDMSVTKHAVDIGKIENIDEAKAHQIADVLKEEGITDIKISD